jgi:hypothetical protein
MARRFLVTVPRFGAPAAMTPRAMCRIDTARGRLVFFSFLCDARDAAPRQQSIVIRSVIDLLEQAYLLCTAFNNMVHG